LDQEKRASHKQQATSHKLATIWWYGGNNERGEMKQELKKINDELLEFYNRPGMALHFQPTQLKILKGLITRLVLLEEKYERD
jgi:hypothetical protein